MTIASRYVDIFFVGSKLVCVTATPSMVVLTTSEEDEEDENDAD